MALGRSSALAAAAVAVLAAIFAAELVLGSPSGQDGEFFRHTAPFAKGDSLPDFEFDSFVVKQVTGDNCMQFAPGELQRTVLFINNTAEDQVRGIFFPEPGKSYADYTFSMTSTNDFVLVPEDVLVDPTNTTLDGQIASNITITFDFNKCSGITVYSLIASRASDNTQYCAVTIYFLVAGFCIYTETNNGVKTVYTGKTAPEDVWSRSFESILQVPEYTFKSFFQYIDGKNSTKPVPAVPSISDIAPQFFRRTQLIQYDEQTCDIAGGQYNGSAVLLDPGCGTQFSINSVGGNWPGTFWGVRFTQYIAGSIFVYFGWVPFTVGTDFDGTLYETFIILNITGNPPPVVIEITPAGPFKEEGGEIVTVTMLNTFNAQQRVLNVENVGIYVPFGPPFNTEDIQIQNYTVSAGQGRNLTWNMTVTTVASETRRAVDLTQPPYRFNYFGLIPLDPKVGPEEGGIQVTACAFSIERFNFGVDYLLFDDVQVPQQYMPDQRASRFCLIFELPPRFLIGPRYVYLVSVVVNNTKTVLDYFTYIPANITATIIPSGPSPSDTNDSLWFLGPCLPSTYTAQITPGFIAPVVVIQWSVLDLTTGNPVPLPDSGATSISFDAFTLIQLHDYRIRLQATYFAGSITRQASDTIIVKVTNETRLGVDILPIVPRGVTDPEQPLRVVCVVTFPDAPNCPFPNISYALTFQWRYAGQDLPAFSYLSTTLTNASITPTKLGRDLVIEMDGLVLGKRNVSVVVTMDENNAILGSDREVVNILDEPMQAVTNGGMSRLKWFSGQDLVIDASQSWNPNDGTSLGAISGLRYAFTCQKGASENAITDACGAGFNQGTGTNSIYQITQDKFGSLLGGQNTVFLKVTLTVTHTDTTLPSGTQAIIVELSSTSASIPADSSIVFGSQLLTRYQMDAVPFFRPVQIAPTSTTSGATASYTIVAPPFETDISKFASQINGYWFPGSPGNDLGLLPLLISANSLDPATQYTFGVTLTAASTNQPVNIEVTFTTMPKPEVILLPLSTISGDVTTMFTASAVSTVDFGDNFKYYFYLVSSDGQDICLMGCNGHQNIMFQIPYTGTYKVRVEMHDALGYMMISSQNSSESIVVTDSARSDVGLSSVQFDRLYKSGDANQFELNTWFFNTFFVTALTTTTTTSTGRLAETIVRQTGGTADQVAELLSGLAHIVSLAYPSTLEGKNYALNVANILKLSTIYVTSTNTLYDAFDVLLDIVRRTPSTEVHQFVDEAERAFNFTRKHAVNMAAKGTSRSRLVRQGVNPVLLDYYELVPFIITNALERDGICGVEHSSSTTVSDGDAQLSESSVGGEFFSVDTATSCIAGQVLRLSGSSSSFAWCDQVYGAEGTIGRNTFSLMESDDLIFLSGVQAGNETQGRRMVHTNVYQDQDGRVLPKDAVAFDDCYSLVIQIQPNATRPSPAALAPPKPYGPSSGAALFQYYSPLADTITNAASASNRVTFNSKVPAAFQVRIGVEVPPSNFTVRPTSTLPSGNGGGGGGLSGGAIAGIVVGILIFIIIAVVVSWLIASRCLLVTATPPPPLELDETFVERDVYGRSMWANEMGMNSAMA